MPPLETAWRYQTAVLWSATGAYDTYGQPAVSDPVEVSVRWTDRRSEANLSNGETITLDATVVSGAEVPVHSRMWLGTLEDWDSTGSDTDDTRVMRVATVSVTPDIKNRPTHTHYELGLQRYRNDPGA